jgi:hypothetical protein
MADFVVTALGVAVVVLFIALAVFTYFAFSDLPPS